MFVTQVLNEVLTLAEAVELAGQFGHPLDRSNLLRYVQEGRLAARKSGGTWLTTRSALRGLILSLETERRGRPRQVQIGEGRIVHYTRTPELASALQEIQRLRSALRETALPEEEEQHLWEELTTRAVYHTTHLEGNELSFEEAQAVIEDYRRSQETPSDDGIIR